MASSFFRSVVLKMRHSLRVAFGCFKKFLVAYAGVRRWDAGSGSLSGPMDALVEPHFQPQAWHGDPGARNILLDPVWSPSLSCWALESLYPTDRAFPQRLLGIHAGVIRCFSPFLSGTGDCSDLDC